MWRVTDHQESKISNLEKWSQFDALGQAVLVYELGGVPPVTEKRRGEKHQRQVRWVMHRHECPLLFYCFAFIKVIVSMWFIWFGSRACEACGVSTPHPQSVLFPRALPSMFIITLSLDLIPPHSSQILHRSLKMKKRKKLTCVCHRKGWAIKYIQMHSGSVEL